MKLDARLVLAAVIVMGVARPAAAVERKAFDVIDTAALTSETQKVNDDTRMDLVWYIPNEFWAATLSQDPTVGEAGTEEFLKVLEPYFILAVVSADVSPFGAFDFYSRPDVVEHLRVAALDAEGRETELSVIPDPAPDVVLLLQQIAPILGAAMGPMGQNFHFFVFSDVDEQNNRRMSPYEDGGLKVVTKDRGGAQLNAFSFEFPLDSLFEPRLCPNGKPAHVSWEFCPWTGQRLPE